MNKTLSLAIGAALIIGIGAYVYHEAREEDQAMEQYGTTSMPETSAPVESTNPVSPSDNGATSEVSAGSSSEAAPAPSGITSADVAKHGTRESCWSSINGGVYDLTSWIPNHPGGEGAILKLCGKDGSTAFNRQHGGAAKQATILAGFKIGTLAQ